MNRYPVLALPTFGAGQRRAWNLVDAIDLDLTRTTRVVIDGRELLAASEAFMWGLATALADRGVTFVDLVNACGRRLRPLRRMLIECGIGWHIGPHDCDGCSFDDVKVTL